MNIFPKQVTQDFMNYFYYPVSIDPTKAVYAVSHQTLFCWENAKTLYQVANFKSPTIRGLQISDDGQTLSYVSA